MRIAAVGILVLALAVPARADDRAFSVGTASAARGQKAFGAIDVPAGVDAATRIAVAVVHGARPGPVLAIVPGAHGTEYASIVAVSKLVGGMKIGLVTDALGRTVFEARSPAAGVVLYICAVPSMKKGDTVANVGVLATSPP